MSGRRAVCCITALLFFMTVFSAFATTDGDPALKQGISAYEAGDRQEALSLLRGFVIRNFQDPDLPTAYLYLARIFQEQGSTAEALLYTGRIPEEQKDAGALLVEGLALAASDQKEPALARLLKSNPSQLPPADQLRRATALAEIQIALGQNLEALAAIQRHGEGRDETLLALAHDILQRLSNGDLAEAVFMFQGTPLGQDARAQQANRAFQQGLTEQAKALLAPVLQSALPYPYRPEAEALWRQLGGGDPATIATPSPAFAPSPGPLPAVAPAQPGRALGVLLPLQGPHAPFAQLIRQGMEFALEQHNQSRPGARLVVRDSGTKPEESTRAVSDLAADPSVLAIAGPITGGAAAVAARQAQQLRIPLFALTPKEGIPEIGDFIFRHSLTPLAQIEALLSQTMEHRGLTSFAVLYPETSQGKELAGIFVNAVLRRGGRIVATEGYGENLTDFRIPLRLLKGEDPNKNPTGETTEYVAPPFQALFIPDYPERISLIAPQLGYYGLQGVQLLGIQGWNSPELLRAAGKYLQGAIFADGFYVDAGAANVRRFVEAYSARYGVPPSILEAQGYDVAGLLLQLMVQPQVQDRQGLRESLSRVENFTGAARPFAISANGDTRQSLWLLTVAGDGFAELP